MCGDKKINPAYQKNELNREKFVTRAKIGYIIYVPKC